MTFYKNRNPKLVHTEDTHEMCAKCGYRIYQDIFFFKHSDICEYLAFCRGSRDLDLKEIWISSSDRNNTLGDPVYLIDTLNENNVSITVFKLSGVVGTGYAIFVPNDVAALISLYNEDKFGGLTLKEYLTGVLS